MLNQDNSGTSGEIASGELLPKDPRLKLELTTPLEKAFWYLSILAVGVFACLGIAACIVPGFRIAPVLIAGGFAVLFPVLYWKTDNYYVLDSKRQVLLYHFCFLSYEWEVVISLFSHIAMTGTDYSFTHTNNRKLEASTFHHYYAACILLKNGRMIHVSDFEFDALGSSDCLAREIAKRTGAGYLPAEAGYRVKVEKGPDGKYQLVSDQTDQVVRSSVIYVAVSALLLLGCLIGRYLNM